MSTPFLLDDIFDVKDIDKDGKKFDRVSRIYATSENYEMELILDVNTDIYPIDINTKVTLAITTSLNLDGSPDEGVYDQQGKATLADKFEYVMHGKVFKQSEEKGTSQKISVYASFGGLLMMLKGDPRNLQLDVDSRVYLLMRKV